MTERPLIFSAQMVRALLDGRKTMTRRVVKPQPPEGARYSGVHYACDAPDAWFFNSPHGGHRVRCAFGEGDRLWVREGFAGGRPGVANVIYRAGHENDRTSGPRVNMPWRSPIHMPRWASRLTLVVTDVRVERLQDISEDDARAEGVAKSHPGGWWSGADYQAAPTAKAAFALLWNSIHGPDAWSENPWVCALSFSVARQNIDAPPAPQPEPATGADHG